MEVEIRTHIHDTIRSWIEVRRAIDLFKNDKWLKTTLSKDQKQQVFLLEQLLRTNQWPLESQTKQNSITHFLSHKTTFLILMKNFLLMNTQLLIWILDSKTSQIKLEIDQGQLTILKSRAQMSFQSDQIWWSIRILFYFLKKSGSFYSNGMKEVLLLKEESLWQDQSQVLSSILQSSEQFIVQIKDSPSKKMKSSSLSQSKTNCQKFNTKFVKRSRSTPQIILDFG